MNFFDKLAGKDDKKKKNKQNPLANVGKVFQDIGGQAKSQKFRGGGKSLGGAKPGKLISIELSQPGELGMKVRTEQNARFIHGHNPILLE